MLSIFKKFFGKPEPKVVAPAQPVAAPTSCPSGVNMPTIEVAHLSLAAIVARFPDEMKPLLVRDPDATATVALPMPTILKQLPAGSVRMSLASLHRQAHGLIKPLPSGDKRSVEVPLAEVFRHLRPGAFRRRDQRTIDVPNSGFNLFGDSTNPYAIAPDDAIVPAAAAESEPVVLDLTTEMPAEMPRMLKMDDGLRAQFSNGSSTETESPKVTDGGGPRAFAPSSDITFTPATSVAAPATDAVVPPPAPVATVPKPTGAILSLPLVSLATNWPENVRSEIAALDPAIQVTLPMDDVSAGLAKGRVSFLWKQIHSWLEPECTVPGGVPGDTVLPLPLKVVAPAFLAASKKPAAERKSLTMDESIPALFSDGRPGERKAARCRSRAGCRASGETKRGAGSGGASRPTCSNAFQTAGICWRNFWPAAQAGVDARGNRRRHGQVAWRRRSSGGAPGRGCRLRPLFRTA